MSRRTVSLAADRRGRVPFAVVGVLLLVSSLVLATTLRPNPAPSETAVERAVGEMTATSQTAVRDGVATASRRAAADPVVEPANTTVGAALNDSRPFRSALRLRVYLQVRDRLGRLSTTGDGVTATASLPAVNTTSGYEAAIERVHLDRAGANNTSVEATVENVTVTVRRSGEVVTRRNVTHTVTVPTPILHVHERVRTYETRLNNSLARPGLAQRTTARLYPITWARGYAQFGGAPIDNVVTNRHVSLATNGALLGVQRSVFGRSDQAGRQALAEATAATGIEDVVAPQTSGAFADTVLGQAQYTPASQNISTGSDIDAPTPNETMRIGVNETADAAFDSVANTTELNALVHEVYSADVRVVTERESLGGGRPDRPDSPGEGWAFDGEYTTTSATVDGNVSARPSAPSGWHTLDGFGRTVTVTHRRVASWTNPDAQVTTQQTVATRTEQFEVRAVIVGRHANDSVAPVRGIETAHERGAGPFDGENLADIEPAAETALLGNTSRDGAAEAMALGEFDRGTTTVTGEYSLSMSTWLYEDLRGLRETVRDINTTVERGAVGSFEANPARQLHRRLEARRSRLISVPDTYNSTAERARIAARIAYVDAVSARLADRSDHHSAVESNVGAQLRNRTGGSLSGLRRALTARETRVPRTRPTPTGPAGPVRTRVDAQPQYLTLASVSSAQSPAVNGSEHPLVARNVNVFSIPYGNAATAALDTAAGNSNGVTIASAALTLRAANETNASASNATLRTNRSALQDSVADANGHVTAALAEEVRAQTDANRSASRDIVEDAMSRWETTADRGLAIANDSAASAIADVADERRNLDAVEEDWLRIRLDRTTTTALATAGARPEEGVVNRTANNVRRVARNRLQTAIEDRTTREVQDVAQRRLGKRVLPAGLPVAPPVAPWYATTNVWWVTVEGEYARFTVSARHGTTATGGTTMQYAREDESVTIDADGDGEAERLGRNTRLSFHVETGVVMVVPPKPRGVGDKNGNSVETSAGWPEPG